MTAANSATAAMVAGSNSLMPLSFDGDASLFALSLGGMTALMVLGLAVVGANILTMAKTWRIDRWNHPVSIWRSAFLLIGLATAARCGAEAMLLWSWSPQDAETAARVQMAKRWIDLFAIACGLGWIILFALSRNEMERHLQRRPLPVNVWAMLPSLKRPTLAVVLSFAAAIGVVWTRG